MKVHPFALLIAFHDCNSSSHFNYKMQSFTPWTVDVFVEEEQRNLLKLRESRIEMLYVSKANDWCTSNCSKMWKNAENIFSTTFLSPHKIFLSGLSAILLWSFLLTRRVLQHSTETSSRAHHNKITSLEKI